MQIYTSKRALGYEAAISVEFHLIGIYKVFSALLDPAKLPVLD